MKYNRNWKNKCGIYAIVCIPTNKMYIGKSKNLYNRLKTHTTTLNRKVSKHENPYLINAWHKYGEDNFKIEILEYCKYEELSEKELYWILFHNTINQKFGYNLRLDTELGMIPSTSTRKKMSISRKRNEALKTDEEKELEKTIQVERWKKYSITELNDIKDSLSKSRTKYKWFQYDRDMNLIKSWNSVRDILKVNPIFKRHNIYACASGEKPTMYNFIWTKKLMI